MPRRSDDACLLSMLEHRYGQMSIGQGTAMRRQWGAVVFLGILFADLGTVHALEILITAPGSGTLVHQREIVAGRVSDPEAALWVVIHPVGSNRYWVQPRPMKHDGLWCVPAYFGQPIAQHSGRRFEVRSFANPWERLSESKLLPGWPQADAQSNLVLVSRR
jgi:hypothetical protein